MTTRGREDHTDLDTVLDLASIVSYDEGGLHDGGELDVAVALVLPLELIQQGLVGGLRETEIKTNRKFWFEEQSTFFTSAFQMKAHEGEELGQQIPALMHLFKVVDYVMKTAA